MFVTTNICRDKCLVATKILLLAAPANNGGLGCGGGVRLKGLNGEARSKHSLTRRHVTDYRQNGYHNGGREPSSAKQLVYSLVDRFNLCREQNNPVLLLSIKRNHEAF